MASTDKLLDLTQRSLIGNREKLVETSVFLEKIFYKIRFLQWRTPFCQKNTSYNTENEVFK